MKNKEKFAKEITEIACSGSCLSVNKATGKPTKCVDISCEECLRHDERNICGQKLLRQWAESEYIEKPVISKKDRAFLDYLEEEYKHIARDKMMPYTHTMQNHVRYVRVGVQVALMIGFV